MAEFKKWIGEGINSSIKDSVSNNVLNILRALVEDQDSIVYIPDTYTSSSKYRYSADPAVHFYPTECGKAVRVTGLQSNQERFSFSVNCLVDVMVEFPKEDGSVELKAKKIFRQYTIIRDGELTINYVSAKLSKQSFEDLKSIGILYYNGVAVPESHEHNPDFVYKISFEGLPLVSTAWAQPINIGLIDYMKREQQLTVNIKTMKSLLKVLRETSPEELPESEEESDIYIEKSETLEKKESTAPTKEVTCIIYSANLPEYVCDLEKTYTSVSELEEDIKSCNKELKYVRFIIRCIVFAIESAKKQTSFNWTEPAPVPRTRTGKMFQTAEIEVEGSTYQVTKTFYKIKV